MSIIGTVRAETDAFWLTTRASNVTHNRILRVLPEDELGLLQPHLVPIVLHQHDSLYFVGARIEWVYFVESGLVSLLVLTPTGEAIEPPIALHNVSDDDLRTPEAYVGNVEWDQRFGRKTA